MKLGRRFTSPTQPGKEFVATRWYSEGGASDCPGLRGLEVDPKTNQLTGLAVDFPRIGSADLFMFFPDTLGECRTARIRNVMASFGLIPSGDEILRKAGYEPRYGRPGRPTVLEYQKPVAAPTPSVSKYYRARIHYHTFTYP